MTDIDQAGTPAIAPETRSQPSLQAQIEEIENSHPWGIIAFLGAWVYLLLTYFF